MQFELGVTIAVGTQLLVEGLMYKLHGGVLAFETLHHLWHEAVKFGLARIFR